MKYRFTEQESWRCPISLMYDPFGKGVATVLAELDDDPSGFLDAFIDEFIARFEGIWAAYGGNLLSQGFTMPELVAAHTSTEIVVCDLAEGVPDSWSLECLFDFPDGPTLSYGIEFQGWETDGHFTGCH